ncbi:hypothetical protein HF521_002830 [Silurus meridionalis]|uniref:Uncharacterized protein n=1 Tax=Silurus meridionalis TaxID=175797 RepID=A0A8T0B5N6_SILME|nr:hypothetical protein HF521_002830 [Silurus meridionalis]
MSWRKDGEPQPGGSGLSDCSGLSLPLVTETQRNDTLPDFLPPNEIHIEEFEDGDDYSQDHTHRYSFGMENLYRGTKRRRSFEQTTEKALPRKRQCEENKDDVYKVVDLTFSERRSYLLSGSSPTTGFISIEDASSSTEDFWWPMIRTMEQADVENDHEEAPSTRSQCVEKDDDLYEVVELTFLERDSSPFRDFIPIEDASSSTEDCWWAMIRTMEQADVENDHEEAPSTRSQCVEEDNDVYEVVELTF